MSKDTKAILIGGGIGSLAAAAFMIRDGAMRGENITILEAAPVLGGSLDGAGNPTDGYRLRGGRMLTSDNYECTWDLFKSIPSLEFQNQSVFDETMAFNQKHKSHAFGAIGRCSTRESPGRFDGLFDAGPRRAARTFQGGRGCDGRGPHHRLVVPGIL